MKKPRNYYRMLIFHQQKFREYVSILSCYHVMGCEFFIIIPWSLIYEWFFVIYDWYVTYICNWKIPTTLTWLYLYVGLYFDINELISFVSTVHICLADWFTPGYSAITLTAVLVRPPDIYESKPFTALEWTIVRVKIDSYYWIITIVHRISRWFKS